MAKQQKPVELKEADLDKAAGGTDGSRGKQTNQNIGSQSTGAGAGKVTFNPF